MSDGYVLYNPAPAGKKNKSDFKMKLLKILVAVFSVILVLEAALYAVVMPCFAPARISFAGASILPVEQLYRQLSPLAGQSWLQFDAARATALLTENAAISDVSVEKRFPDQVLFTVTERVPVAVSLAVVNGNTVPVQIDRNGVVFAVNKGLPAKAVPLVSGLSFTEPAEGMRLPLRDRKLMLQIEEIGKNKPEYFSAISEIKILAKDHGNYDLVLYPAHSHTKVYTDRTLNEESLQYMMVVLDVVNSMDSHVSEVDLRYGSVSCKTYM